MTLGPLEYIVIGFEGKQTLDGSVAHELEKVVANGTIRIVDLVFIARDDDDKAVAVELDAKADPRFATFAPLLRGSMALLTAEDIETVAETLPDNTAALVDPVRASLGGRHQGCDRSRRAASSSAAPSSRPRSSRT